MKIDFKLPTDGKMHRFCVDCRAEDVDQVHDNGKTVYHCNVCGKTNTRAIYFNKHKFWSDEDKELWHESAGVFVRNKDDKYLFFQRTEFPFSLTVPAGHVDENESAQTAAIRELEEEVGLKAETLHDLGTEDLWGDSCSAGADVHKWHVYFLQLDNKKDVEVQEEGEKPVWLSLEEAKKSDLAFAINDIVLSYEKKLNNL